jgi:predicted Fe-Mo cluster-binding NifX family protein
MTDNIAITVQSTNGLASLLDPRFGRASGFVIVNRKTRAIVREVENRFVEFAHGAGTGAASLMQEQEVGAVISGRFGPKAEQALAALDIEMWSAPEGITAGEVLDLLASGELDHWGAAAPRAVSSGSTLRASGGGGEGRGRGRGGGSGGGGGGGRGRGRGGGGGGGGQGRGRGRGGGGGGGGGRR